MQGDESAGGSKGKSSGAGTAVAEWPSSPGPRPASAPADARTRSGSRSDGAQKCGDLLRTERERRGIELDQVSRATRIGLHYLEAIERNDWAALPDPVFARGYLRAVSELVGLDPDYSLKAYARELRI